MRIFFVIAILFASFVYKNTIAKTPDKSIESTPDSTIQYIDLVHCTHTDFGYTDHPVIAEELHLRYFDMAVSLALESTNAKQPFVWTAEALEPVERWWKEASPEKQKTLLKLIQNKQISVSALPFHIHPIVGETQWNTMTNWADKELWEKLHPKVGMQHDVTGFPRAAAIKLLDKGIKYIWTGINEYKANAPFKTPYPFWWKMPDERKLLVWCGFPYWEGYLFFAEKEWRSKQREASNTQFWSPREGDMLQADEQSVKKAHEICLKRVKQMKKEGYPYDFIAISITNQWRIDNDGPFPGLPAFVQKWNELGLLPKLNLVTVDEAMQKIEKRVGDIIPEHAGEWMDWWSFGVTANPRELSVARLAVNYLDAALSPLWGLPDDQINKKINEINRMLCRYYEHTFSSNVSLTAPYSYSQLGQLNEKGIYAFRPYEKAKWLLAQRTRKLLSNKAEGLYIVNTHKNEYSGWIELDSIAFRGINYKCVENTETGELIKLSKSDGTKFWANKLQGEKIYRFILKTNNPDDQVQQINKPIIKVDENNWPVYIKWDKMETPLITDDLAGISALQIDGMQWFVSSIFNMQDSLRSAVLEEKIKEIFSIPEDKAVVEESKYSIRYTQKIKHPRMNWATRQLEIYKSEPKISIEVSFDRISSKAPEVIYINFPLPDELKSPQASCGGIPFMLYTDQLPNSCKDYFTIDDWVSYKTSDLGNWIWTSRDAPLVTFGSHNLCARIKTKPDNANLIKSMVYNNTWEVNFLSDSPGIMTFRYDLDWKKNNQEISEINEIVKTNLFPPVVYRNPATRVNPISLDIMTK